MVSRSNICCSLARKCPDNKLCAGLVSRVARLCPGTVGAAGRLPIVYLDGSHGQGGSREATGDCSSYPVAPTIPSGRRPGPTAAWRTGCQLTQLLRLAHLLFDVSNFPISLHRAKARRNKARKNTGSLRVKGRN